MKKAVLALENGMVFEGVGFGDLEVEAVGELVFNTAMTGYQEVLTDPSYMGQLITFTYPHIGNYGINSFDNESDHFQAEGVIVKECAKSYSNWRAEISLEQFLQRSHKIGIEGIDTRKLVRVLRSEGAMRGIISAKDVESDQLVERARSAPEMEGLDLVKEATTKEAYQWRHNPDDPLLAPAQGIVENRERYKVVAFDFGVKRNILRRLAKYGCDITVLPADASAQEALEHNPDGIFLSNGPGDPAAVDYAVRTIRELAGRIPIFGICLGHQLLALALGATTFKLKFGHHGVNHPIKNLETGVVEITSQNHGFAVERASMPENLKLTHLNLNDQTVAGFRCVDAPIFCVQYHPEASPGTHDSDYLFMQFIELMQEHRTPEAIPLQT